MPFAIPRASSTTAHILLGLTVLAGLFVASGYSYLLFHIFAEFFSVAVACGIFIIAWNARSIMNNNYFLFIGISCLFVGAIDLLHTLAYKNMGIFPQNDANLPTQLWVAARLVQSVSFCLAPLFLKRKIKPALTVAAFSAVTSLLVLLIFTGMFPDCFIEGTGLTPFKKVCEYSIALLLLASLLLVRYNRDSFDPEVARLLIAAFLMLILSELFFTIYTDVFGIRNKLGHFLKIAGFFCIYKALIEIGLTRPYDLLFRELKKSEEALLRERNELRESEERYRRLYKDTPVMLHSIDRHGLLVNVSNHWLAHLGYSWEEVISRKSTDFLTESSRRYAEEVVLPEFFRTGYCHEIPYQLVKKNGDVIDVVTTASAERDDSGEIVRSLAVMVDVTERKRAEEEIRILNKSLAARAAELQSANAELEAFNYTVSHDLRAPLANISSSCTVLTEVFGRKLDDKQKEFLGFIDTETRRMSNLIQTLLNFSQMSRQELHMGEVDLSRLALEVSLQLKIRQPDRKVEFLIAEEIRCRGDKALLRVVLENLIGNSWKYTGKCDAAEIEFGVAEKSGVTWYFVRDNGAGFDADKAEHIFRPFQRLHSSEFEGTGIGLATVNRIIERHGGKVTAEGEVGKGATFSFTLNT